MEAANSNGTNGETLHATPSGLRTGLAPGVGRFQSSTSEVTSLTFGILPLVDCAPLVVAHTHGLFARHGLESKIAKYPSWTAIRDALNRGETHAAHMLFGMPVAAAVGKLGTDQPPLVAPWILSRNGQAITLGARHRGKFASDATAIRPLARERRDIGRPLVFGATLPIGTHALWLRYWLAAGHIDPDNDIALITVPPPQMVGNLRTGRMDGFCVGEPWNARAIADNLGFTAITSEEIWPDHPEKVLAFTEEFAESQPGSVKATLKALHEASEWCDDPANHNALAELLAQPEYVGGPPELIRARLGGRMDYGDGRTRDDLHGVTFSARGANYPQTKFALWWLAQLRRWKLLPIQPDYFGVAARVMRPDLYEAALAELGVAHGGLDLEPFTLFDGVRFDPSEPEQSILEFPIHHLRDPKSTVTL